jgi:hypothetical protein
MVVASVIVSGSCLLGFVVSNVLISDIDYYKRHEVYGLLRVYLIYVFCNPLSVLGVFDS